MPARAAPSRSPGWPVFVLLLLWIAFFGFVFAPRGSSG